MTPLSDIEIKFVKEKLEEGFAQFVPKRYLWGNMTEDKVNHPSHYNTGKIEVIEFIEDKNLGFHLGNAVKYIARAGKKDSDKEQEDLAKAIWYIRRYAEIKFVESPKRPNDMPKASK